MSTTALPFQPPRSIARKVARLRLAVRLYVLAEGLAALAIVVGAAFWAGLAIDWMFEPSPAVRVLMWAAALAIAAIVAWRYLLRRSFAALRSDSLALLVERKYPQLGEGLVTTVQAAGEADPGPVRRLMLDASARRTAEEMPRVRLGSVFDFRPLASKALVGLTLLAAIGVFAATQRDAFGFWVDRLKLSEQLWPRRVSLSVVGFPERDGQRVVNVARDDAFELQAYASLRDGHEAPAEVEVRWRTADGRRGRGPMTKIGDAAAGDVQGQLYQYAFKVSSEVTFDVVGGDDRITGLRLRPVERPAVKNLALDAKYPGYLRREPRLVPVASGRAELPEGARAVCRAAANKPLASVIVRDPALQADLPVAVERDATEFSFDLGAVTADRVLLITMHDADGVHNREPFRLAVAAVPDAAPEVNVQLHGIGTAITPQARIPLVGRVIDDYELVRAWFEYQVDEAPPEQRPFRAQPESLANLRMTEPFDLAEAASDGARPLVELKAGQRFTLSVGAQDAYDLGQAPHTGQSPRFQLDVVTPSQLRSLLEKRELGLRQRFEAIYEKMVGVRDLVERIDLAARQGEADDEPSEAAPAAGAAPAEPQGAQADAADEQSMTPAERRQRAVARINGARQSATQLAFETGGIAEGFDEILAELVNNRVDTEELNQRLQHGISEPLMAISTERMPAFEQRLAALQGMVAAGSPPEASLAAAREEADSLVEAMKGVLDRMLELESYNELVDLLRGIVTDQQKLREETLRQQREKLRELLEE